MDKKDNDFSFESGGHGRRIAVRNDWKISDMPKEHEMFILSRTFTPQQMSSLRNGHVPEQMEDKWFWFMEGDTLFAHRSWSGFCIYRIDFKADDKHIVNVNSCPEQYERGSDDEETKTLNRLLDRWTEKPYDHYGEWLEETLETVQKKQPAKALSPDEVRAARIDIFTDTFNQCRTDPALIAAVAASKIKTEVFAENQYPPFFPSGCETGITVSKKRSFQAAADIKKEYPESKIAVLNFANAFYPGGGVASGASAQEECLCRCSTLYPLLYRKSLENSFYGYHKKIGDPKATDALIYTEGVVIFKTDTAFPEMMKKSDWVTVDVITCAAPDMRKSSNRHVPLTGNASKMSDPELFGYHVRRAIHILTVAAAKKADNLVLGAFGCGAFENDPHVVARAYKTALQEFKGVFRRIEFAIYSPPGNEENYRAFSKAFAD